MAKNKDHDKISATDVDKNPEIEVLAGGGIEPYGITVSRCGNVLFTDFSNRSLTIISPQGERKCVGKRESGLGEFGLLFDVTTNKDEEIFITDYCHRRVQILDKDGKFLRNIQVGTSPIGICLDEDENIYVTTNGPQQIVKYGKDGKEIKKMKSKKFGDLRYLVHHQGNLYIADYDASIIHVVTKELEYVTNIGKRLFTKLIKAPIGITIDQENTLLVTVRPSGIAALTLGGRLLKKIAVESIKDARGITTSIISNKIVVCDLGNERIVRI